MKRRWILAFALCLAAFAAPSQSHAKVAYIGRHGLTSAQYQDEYNKQAKAGYRLVHVDGYASGNEARYAAIWEKSGGPARVARHGLDGGQYQAEFDKQAKAGYRLVLVDGYGVNGQARYAAIWEKSSGAPRSARHGMSSDQYQTQYNEHAKAGYRLVYVSGYGVGPNAHYAAIWEKSSGPERIARHGMTSDKYQSEFDAHTKAGYRLVHVSAYDVNGVDYYAAIWEKSSANPWLARHRMSGQTYQSEFTQHYQEGYRLVSVSGNNVGASTRYAAIWEAQDDAETGNYCANGQCFSLDVLGQKIAEKIKPYTTNKVVKYGFEATRGIAKVNGAYGPKRTSKTPPAGSFSVNDRFNPASVSKAVTAIALLQLLDKRKIAVDSKIAPFLPPTWTLPTSSKTITFAQVLNHSSGLRNANAIFDGKTDYRYENVKAVVEGGVSQADKDACASGSKMPDGTGCYQNVNYALARELVASLDGFGQWAGNPGAASSARFIAYVNDHVFAPIGVFDVRYKSEGSDNTLFFPYPTGDSKGTDYGDWSLKPGSAGGHNSIHELAFFARAVFARTLLSTQKLAELKAEGLGMGLYATLPDGSNCWGKGGFFPGSMNGGAQLESVIVGCDNGVSVALVINGEKSAKSVVVDALKEAFSAQTSAAKPFKLPLLTEAKTLQRAQSIRRSVDE